MMRECNHIRGSNDGENVISGVLMMGECNIRGSNDGGV